MTKSETKTVFFIGIVILIFLGVTITIPIWFDSQHEYNEYSAIVEEIIEIESPKIQQSPQSNNIVKIINSNKIDSTAIGKIKFCISENEFNCKKKEFLNSHSVFGGLTISSLKGFFLDNQLAAIEIISKKQSIFFNNNQSQQGNRNLLNILHGEKGWSNMFLNKYKGKYDWLTGCYETSIKSIFVTDVCSTSLPSNSYKEVINRKYPVLRFIEPLPNITFKDNVEGMEYVGMAFSYASSNRSKYLYEEMSREISQASKNYFSSTTNIYQHYYNELREEANFNINRNNTKIENAPSWSVIRIIFKPLQEQYLSEIRAKEEEADNKYLKDMDLI